MIATVRMAQIYKRTSRNDLFALSLAKQEHCPLLTGDKHLKETAESSSRGGHPPRLSHHPACVLRTKAVSRGEPQLLPSFC